MTNPIIGIAGNARSGKDTLGKNWLNSLKNNGIKAKRYAFADELKKEVDSFLLDKLGISAWTQDDEEKLVIRPFLVFWGTEIRRKMDINHWIKQLVKTIEANGDDHVAIVTDMRFRNEHEWIKLDPNSFTFMIQREGAPPANAYEATHNGVLAALVDQSATLAKIEDPDLLEAASDMLLERLVPIEIITQWRQTYPL